MRIDHWFKNVFVLPGIVAGLSLDSAPPTTGLTLQILTGLAAVCLIVSSNYVLNEVLDAPFDRQHPTKRYRPVPSGQVNVTWAYVQWLILMVAGMGVALTVSRRFAVVLLALWVMGCLYNLPPIRTKDVPYVDVLSEAVNNPLRLLAGWYMSTSHSLVPASLLLSYWMVGCYFMAIKRFAELRDMHNTAAAAQYRKSFAFYTEQRLLVSVMFYGAAAMLFFGAFVMRYRLELILTFPLVALVMSTYLALAFRPNSPAQQPEHLYRQPSLMAAVVGCALLMALLFFVDLPVLHEVFSPSIPTLYGRAPR
jgi:4-hydroxybenzoate polyprenyltransferase